MATNKDKIRAAAQKYLQRGQIDKAIKEFQRLVEDDPKDVRTLLKIGDLQTRKGDHGAATQTYRQVAEFYSAQGFFLKAVAVYKQTLKLDPDLVEVNLKLADLYQQLGLLSDAANQYRVTYHIYEQAGRTEDGFQTLQKLIELDPDNIAIRVKLAEAYALQGRLEEACQGFREAAVVLKSQGRLDDYVKVGERLVHLDPNDVATARDLADVYVQRGDAKRALAKLQICYRVDPKDVHTLELMADAFRSLGQAQKTVSVYREVARIQDEAGNREGRLAAYRAIVELAPDDTEATAALAAAQPVAVAQPAAVAEPAGPSVPPGAYEEDQAQDPGTTSAVARISVAHRQLAVPSQVKEVNRAAPQTPPVVAAAAASGQDVSSTEVDKLLVEVEIYAKYGLRNKALEHLDRILATLPANREAQEKRKDLLLEGGETEAAVQALWAMAQAAHVAGMLARAKADLEELLALAPDNAAARALAEQLGAGASMQAAAPRSTIDISIDELADADGDEGPEVLVEEAEDSMLSGAAAGEFVAQFDVGEGAAPAAGAPAPQASVLVSGGGEGSPDAEVAAGEDVPDPAGAERELEVATEFATPDDVVLDEGVSVELDADEAAVVIADAGSAAADGLELEVDETEAVPAAAAATAAARAHPDLELEPGDGEPAAGPPTPAPHPTAAPTAKLQPADSAPASAAPEAAKLGLDPDLEALIASAVPARRPAARRSEEQAPRAQPVSASVVSLEPSAEAASAVSAAPRALAVEPAEQGPLTDVPGTEVDPDVGDTQVINQSEGSQATGLLDDGEYLSAEDSSAALAAADAAVLESVGQATEDDVFGAADAAADAVSRVVADAQRFGGATEASGDAEPAADAVADAPAASVAEAEAAADIREEIEEVHFLIDQGLTDEAQEAVATLLAQHPANPQVVGLMSLLDLDDDDTVVGDGEDDEAEPEPEISTHCVDLNEEIAEELRDENLGDDFQVSLAEVFDEFKRGVAEQVDDSDHETHYDLGIAYKEMGLVDDAIREFNLAARAPGRQISALTMIGLCQLERDNTSAALQTFLRGLNSEHVTPRESVALRYEIGHAYESQGRQAEARRFYEKAYSMDPQFRDVAQRLQQLGSRSNKAAGVATELDELLNETRAEQEAMRKHKGKVSYL